MLSTKGRTDPAIPLAISNPCPVFACGVPGIVFSVAVSIGFFVPPEIGLAERVAIS